MDNHSLTVNLSRLNNKKIVKRICRGFYANPFNTPTLEEISNQIYQPSYISLESALYSWGILSQIPYVLTCVTTHLPRTFNTSFGSIEFITSYFLSKISHLPNFACPFAHLLI